MADCTPAQPADQRRLLCGQVSEPVARRAGCGGGRSFSGALYHSAAYRYSNPAGIQILLQIAGYGTIDSVLAAGLAFGLIVAFVLVSGLRGAAWASLIKDALVLGAVLFAGIVLPMQFFGSPQGVIDQVLKMQPNWMTLVGGTNNFGTVWFVSTVLLTGFGGFMWPHSIAAVYAAKSEEAVRRNAIILPFYQIMLLLVYFAGVRTVERRPLSSMGEGFRGMEQDRAKSGLPKRA